MITVRAAISLLVLATTACQQQSETPAYTAWQTRTTGAEQPSTRATRASEAPTVIAVTSAPPITTLAAMIADERVDPSAPLPPAPGEPSVAPAIEQQARSLQALVARTEECWSNPPYARIAHFPPPECEQWFATLGAGGEASGIAIGRHLAATDRAVSGQPLDRLSAILSNSAARTGLAWVLRRIHQNAAVATEPSAAGMLRATAMDADIATFEAGTGFPVNDQPPWLSAQDPEVIATARSGAVRALRFWSRIGPSADWRAHSEQRLRLWLSADDARVIRATQLIVRRSASASLEPEAKEALRRVVRTTTQASPRALAQNLLGMLESNNRGYR